MTTAVDARGTDDLPLWVRRSWLVPAVLGGLLIVAGVLLLINLNAGIRTLHWLVVIGIVMAAIQAFATASLRHRPWWGWVVGALYLVGAIVAIAWPGVTLFALLLIVGISLLTSGLAQAIASWQQRRTAHGWGWGFALGLLGAVAGLVFLFGNPVISLVALAIVLACYTISSGVTMLTLALAVRRLTGSLAGPPDPALGPA
jgi:uncharacterized membrane protein HdeD (DUF308 family)